MIAIRAPQLADVDALHPLIAGTSVAETLLWDGPESLEDYRRSWTTKVEAVEKRECHMFTIVEEASGAVVGTADIRPVERQGQPPLFRAEVGLFIGLPFQGRGYGTKVVRELLEHGFGAMALEKMEATVFVGNMASRRIFEKNGFVLEGTIRKAVRKRGRLLDDWVFGIVRRDFVSA